MRLFIATFIALCMAPLTFADVIPSNVTVSVSTAALVGAADDTITDFGTATANLVPLSSTTSTLSAPVVDNGAGTVTISGTGNASGIVGTLGAAIDSGFDVTVGCDFTYAYTATVTQIDAASFPSSYGISAGVSNSTGILPVPGTSPISLNGAIASGGSESFGFLALLPDVGGDGFNVDFTYELVLTALDPANCDCFTAVPEPSSFLFLSLIGAAVVVSKKRKLAA